MTWYTSPEALALLDGFKRRPRVHKPKNTAFCADFRGRRVDALGSLWVLREGPSPSPWHVLGAVFGDPNTSGYNSHWDTSEEWAEIRAKLAATGGLTARRAVRRQKEVSRGSRA